MHIVHKNKCEVAITATLTHIPKFVANIYTMYLDLSYNTIEQIGPIIYEMPNLSKLNVSYNNISNFEINCSKLKHLREIDLSNNLLQSIPFYTFSKSKSLVKLNLTNNFLRSLPQMPPNLKILKISLPSLKTIPQHIFPKCLQYLHIESSNIQNYDEIFANIELQHLSLPNNNIKYIPSNITQLKKLKYLDLSFNKINNCHYKYLSKLFSLNYLNIHGNDFVNDMSIFKKLTNLKILRARCLKIEPSFCKMINLKNIDVFSNKPTQRTTISTILNMTFIDRLRIIAPTKCLQIKQYQCRLKTLHLPRNGLKNFVNLHYLINLEFLGLEENKLTKIPPKIKNLKKLSVLLLHNNRLKKIPKEIGYLNNLKMLTFYDNPVEQISININLLLPKCVITHKLPINLQYISKKRYDIALLFCRAIISSKSKVYNFAKNYFYDKNIVKEIFKHFSINTQIKFKTKK